MLIRPKAGILDPQGVAVERALPALGFAGVSDVHVADAGEAERRKRTLDSDSLGVEDPGLRPDQNPRPHAEPARASQASKGSPLMRS